MKRRVGVPIVIGVVLAVVTLALVAWWLRQQNPELLDFSSGARATALTDCDLRNRSAAFPNSFSLPGT
jgi:hypothetical protein